MRNYLTNRNFNTFDIFDDFFDSFFKPTTFNQKVGNMRADIKENEKEYELSVDLPGFDKKDINLTLNDGYLTISAKAEEKQEDKDNYIRRERVCSCQRSFYVGDVISEEDIKAKYNNGTLVLNIPKLERKEIPTRHIQID